MFIASGYGIYNFNKFKKIELMGNFIGLFEEIEKVNGSETGITLGEYENGEQAQRAFKQLKYRMACGENLIDMETLLEPRKGNK